MNSPKLVGVVFGILVAMLFSGCATTQGLKTSRGDGESRVYETAYSTLWQACMWAVEANELELEEFREDEGYILAKKGMSFFSYGERVAVFIDRQDNREAVIDSTGSSTPTRFTVEIISKRKLATNLFAKDWTTSLFASLESRLPEEALLLIRDPAEDPSP